MAKQEKAKESKRAKKPIEFKIETGDANMVIDRYREGAVNYRYPRQAEWDKNKEFYHVKSTPNGLTQRNGLTSTITKQTVNTIHSQTSVPPDISFEIVGDDEGAMIAANAFWDNYFERDNIEQKEAIDTKQELLYGRTYALIGVRNGYMSTDILHPMTVLVDRYTPVWDINAGHFNEITNIFRTIGEIQQDPDYNTTAVKDLVDVYEEQFAAVRDQRQQGDNYAIDESNNTIGDIDTINTPLGEVQIELARSFVKFDRPDQVKYAVSMFGEDSKKGKQIEEDGFVWYEVVRHQQTYLYFEPVIKKYGVNKTRIVSWCADLENAYWYSNSVADDVRPQTEISNTLINQWLENRARVNFNMQYFDATKGNFDPETFKPIPGALIPMPGNPNEILMQMPVQGLEENITPLNYFEGNAQKVSAATNQQMGVRDTGEKTLGELEMQDKNASSRISSLRRNHNAYWRDIATLWLEILVENQDKLKSLKAIKKGKNGEIYEKIIKPKDFAKNKFNIVVTSSNEQKQKSIEKVQVLQYLGQILPKTPITTEILAKEAGKLLDMSTQERKDFVEAIMGEGGINTDQEAEGQIGSALAQGDNAGIPSATMPQAMAGQNVMG